MLSLLQRACHSRCAVRTLTTTAHTAEPPALKRSHLYVPASSDRMLEKSLTTASDVIVYDLEDSVPPTPNDKLAARSRLSAFLQREDLPARHRVAVRVNDITTPFFAEDIAVIASSKRVGSLVLPKVHAAEDLDVVSQALNAANRIVSNSLSLIASIESARASFNLGNIAAWRASDPLGGTLTALLFAAEDYCADTSILRSPSRRELLYTRSSIVIAAKAFKLDAIDMVCVNYKDSAYLEEECKDGRQLGFTGKQAIHPSQVDIIQSTFVPTSAEIERAAKIIHQMEREHAANRGATGLDGEMIDMPMILQARKILSVARAAKLEIPTF